MMSYIGDPIHVAMKHPQHDAQSELHDGALLCVTDLEDCCDAPHTVRGDWYYPDGRTVPTVNLSNLYHGSAFQRNRGPHEVNDGLQFYGSVRLFRRWSNPPERGRFRCEIPSAADPNVTQYSMQILVSYS